MLFSSRMEKENRAHPRYEVSAKVDLTEPSGTSSRPIQNLSLGGICIQTPSLEEVGASVDVLLRFPELGAEMAVRGEVVWVNREPPAEVGIRWLDLDEERRALLARYFEVVRRAT
jgi:uncharacterized protein (TIGR02266 family)